MVTTRNLPEAHIRRAGPHDLDRIDVLESEAFSADRFARRNLRRLLARSSALVLIAERGQTPVGYALVLFSRRTRIARLYSIAVSQANRGSGVGAALLKRAASEARMRGKRVLRLEVRASNKAALRSYERAGFEECGRRASYYPDGEDAVIMQIGLNGQGA